MGRLIAVLSCLCLVSGCGVHAPKSANGSYHNEHIEGETLVTFFGSPWSPGTTGEAVEQAKASVRSQIMARVQDFDSKGAAKIKIKKAWLVRSDTGGTMYVRVKYAVDIKVLSGTSVALNL